ncbi:MAG: hypothetical protein HPY61_11255 [Methanotrichaceae archaeon]|nr:hypothetical protein [Methanotrichaceae archaeon]
MAEKFQMALKFGFAGLLLLTMLLATTGEAIEYLKGTTYWDVAEVQGITVGDFHPISWRFESYDADAKAGTVEAQGAWSGTWKEVGCKTIYCEITGGYDSWYLTFVNPRYFFAYKERDGSYPLYRLGKMKGEPYNLNTVVSA